MSRILGFIRTTIHDAGRDACRLSLIGALALGTQVATADPQWTSTTWPDAAGREWPASDYAPPYVLVWGGATTVAGAEPDTTAGARLDPATNLWTAMNPSPAGTGRINFAHAWAPEIHRWLIWGGYNGAALGDGLSYDPATNAWQPLPPIPASAIGLYSTTGIWTGSSFITWGGNPIGGTSNQGLEYTPDPANPATGTWDLLPAPNSVLPRRTHAMVWSGQEVLIYGGVDSSGTGMQSGHAYNPTTHTWRDLAPQPTDFTNRGGPKGVWTGDRFLILGDTKAVSYFPLGDHWDSPSTSPGGADLESTEIGWDGTRAYIWGGTPLVSLTFDPVTKAWSNLPTTGEPVARYFHTAVMAGQTFVVWGGRSASNTVLNDGGLLGGSAAPTPTPTVTPTPAPHPVVAVCDNDLAGKRRAGNRVLTKACVSPEDFWPLVASVSFQYRPSGSGPFLPIPAATKNNPNPDSTHPFFVHWDITGLADGPYDVRAVGTDTSGVTDPSPQFITFTKQRNCGHANRE